MKYDGTPENIGMNPHLTAKLDAREEKGWGLPTELSVRFKAGPLTKGYIVCCDGQKFDECANIVHLVLPDKFVK